MGRTRKYKRYNPEFKREALKRASEDGMTDKFVCEELGISSRQLGIIVAYLATIGGLFLAFTAARFLPASIRDKMLNYINLTSLPWHW